MRADALIGIISLMVYVCIMGFFIGASSGYDKGSESMKRVYKPEMEKYAQTLKQLRESAVSYGYAEWVVMDNTNGNTEFRWKAKSINPEK
jgi:hypothetical protein